MNRLNETHKHYIQLLAFYTLLASLGLCGWWLAEHFVWFAGLWDSKTFRFVVIYGVPPLFLFSGIYFYSYFFGRKKFVRSFTNTAKTSLSDCKSGGKVKVRGTLKLLNPELCAPYSGRASACYTLRVLEKVDRVSPSGNGTRSEEAWETFSYNESMNDFVIQCSDSFALVRVKNAKVVITEDATYEPSNYQKDAGGFLLKSDNVFRKRVLESLGLSARRFVGVYAKDIKFVEGVLEDGEQVVVLGEGYWMKTSEDHSLQSLADCGVEHVWCFETSDRSDLKISDLKDVIEPLSP